MKNFQIFKLSNYFSMQKRRNSILAFITAIVLLLWLAAGSYLFSENCCGDGTTVVVGNEATAMLGSLVIEDGEAFKTQANQAILFAKNDAQPIVAEEVSESLIKTVQYIKSNPLKRITIMGLFLGEEANGAQVAKNRADSLAQFFVNSGTPDYQVITQVGRRDDLQQNKEKNMIIGAIDFSFSCIAPFEVKDEKKNFVVQANNNLMFKYASSHFLIAPTKELLSAVEKIAAYLKNQTTQKLVLTGYNHPEEINRTALPNWGVARANMVRDLLVSLGANGGQIEVKGIEDGRLAVVESKLYGKFLPNAMGYSFEPIPANRLKDLEKEKKRIEADFKEMQVFRFKDFEKDENKIIINDKTKTYLNDLILYISLNQKAKIYCVGHSNILDSKEKTEEKGSERALYTKDFLLNHGILSDRIVCKTAGANHPLGEETTKYGQQINRRVDLIVSLDGKEPQLYILPSIKEEEETTTSENKKKKTKSTQDSTKVKNPTTVKKDSLN